MHFLRINGRGNAWPIHFQNSHPMYQENGINEYANASYTICETSSSSYNTNEICWEVLIDAGHGIVPFILNHHNRIPEAILLTHAHFDHILGVDWIVQSYYRINKKKYPIYASEPAIEAFSSVMHHLNDKIEWKVLRVGQTVKINETNGLSVVSYPVYHGYSAKGASILMFSLEGRLNKIMFTGDILCPLVKKQDCETFKNMEMLLVDSNNRFPYPKSNHWSFTKHQSDNEKWEDFINNFEITSLLKPHYMSESEKNYILDVISENANIKSFCWDIMDFIDKTTPQKVGLVHYSGLEDEKYYKEKILNSKELENWAKKIVQDANLSSTIFVPQAGDLYPVFSK